MSEEQNQSDIAKKTLPQFSSNIPVTPPPAGSGVTSFPSLEPISPPPRRSYRFVKVIVSILFSLIGLGVLGSLVVGYLVFAQGKTVFGYSMPDKVWQKIINDSNKPLAERSVKFTYQDSGSFEFTPSHFATSIGYEMSSQEKAKYDRDYSFVLRDLNVSESTEGFVNLTNLEHPKVDVHLEGSVSNNGKTYAGSFDGKLIDIIGYVRYDYNTSVDELFKKFDDVSPGASSSIDSYRNKWLKFKDLKYSDADNSSGAGLLAPLAGARENSRDAKRLADVRQVASALELYFNDCGSYPAGASGSTVTLDNTKMLSEGTATGCGNNNAVTLADGGIRATSSTASGITLLGQFPQAPTPADGKCTDEFNTYTYTAKGKAANNTYEDYELIFCIGGETGGYRAGNLALSRVGISEYNDCPQGKTCYKDASQAPEDPFIKLYRDNRLFDIKSFKGISKVNGTYTWHYELSLNKQKIRNILVDGIKQEAGDDWTEQDTKEFDAYTTLLDIFLEKWNVQKFEVWVGIRDRHIYKTVFESNTLSLTQTIDTFYKELTEGSLNKFIDQSKTQAVNASGDAKRLADIRQLASTLEIYFNDHNGYPAGQNGVPQGIESYIPSIPIAPVASGRCTDYYNNYWYTPTGEGYASTDLQGNAITVYPNYTYTFCLGAVTSGYESGVSELSASGIRHLSDCPEPGKCYKEGTTDSVEAIPTEPESQEDQVIAIVIDIFRKIPFAAQLTIELGAKNFDVDKTIDEPKDALDFEQEMQNRTNRYNEPIPST